MSEAFVEMDRQNMIEVADTYDISIPAYENEAMIARIRELMEPRNTALRERMTAIREEEEAKTVGPGDDVVATTSENLDWQI
jgi:CPA2 family monovalent cation:H+ antiporter-2